MKENIDIIKGTQVDARNLNYSVESMATGIAGYLHASAAPVGYMCPIGTVATLPPTAIRIRARLTFDIQKIVLGVRQDLSTVRTIEIESSDPAELEVVYERERNMAISEAYRDAMRGVGNIARRIDEGEFVLPEGVSAAAYLAALSSTILDAFPNTN